MAAALHTARLLLTPVRPGDERHLWPILSDPITMWAYPQPFSQARVTAWIGWADEAEKTFGLGRYLVRLKETGAVVGDCGFLVWHFEGKVLADLGWLIDHRHWRRGYATEACTAIRDRALQHGVPVLHANMAVDNIPSWRTAEALGFQRLKVFRNSRNRWAPTYLYELRAPLATRGSTSFTSPAGEVASEA